VSVPRGGGNAHDWVSGVGDAGGDSGSDALSAAISALAVLL